MNTSNKKQNNQIIPFGAKDSGLVYTLFIGIMYIIAFIIQGVFTDKQNQYSFTNTFLSTLYSIISILIIIFLVCLMYKRKPLSLVPVKKLRIEYLVISIVLVFAMISGLGGVNNYVVNFFTSLGLKVDSAYFPTENAGQIIAFFFTLCLLPAILEEILFRGLILQGLKNAGTIFAVILSGLLFALYHGSVAQFAYQFIFGVMFALLMVVSGNIIYSMIAHFVNNAVVFFFSLYLPYVNLQAIYLLVVGVILFISILAVFIWRLVKMLKGQDKVSTKRQKLEFLLFSSAGIILTIVSIVLNLVA